MALAALESFDMGEFAGQRADGLSGGQQQRVAIARPSCRSRRSCWPTSRWRPWIRATPAW